MATVHGEQHKMRHDEKETKKPVEYFRHSSMDVKIFTFFQ